MYYDMQGSPDFRGLLDRGPFEMAGAEGLTDAAFALPQEGNEMPTRVVPGVFLGFRDRMAQVFGAAE